MGPVWSCVGLGAHETWRDDVLRPEDELLPLGHSMVWPAGTKYVKMFPYSAPAHKPDEEGMKLNSRIEWSYDESSGIILDWPLSAKYHYVAEYTRPQYTLQSRFCKRTMATVTEPKSMYFHWTCCILAPLSQSYGSEMHWDTLQEDTEMTAHLPHQTAYSKLFGGSIYVRVTKNADMTPHYFGKAVLFDYVEDYWLVPEDPNMALAACRDA